MIEIEVRNVAKQYKADLFKKRVQAVKGLSLQINSGEVYGLIGPNGAGKSTLIRMLMGLLRADSGEVFYRGQAYSSIPESVLRDIGYLPENPYLYDHLTLKELLQFCGRTSGLDKESTAANSERLMHKMNLIDVQDRPLRSFSKGMLQRSGICFALLHDPSLIILDEPMSGLDPLGRKMVFDLVVSLKEEGKTVFFCSHILNDVERLCDRIGLINKGQMVEEFEQTGQIKEMKDAIFLMTESLDVVHLSQLKDMSVGYRREGDGHLLAIDSSALVPVIAFLQKESVKIIGSRKEWLSLEDLFLQKIEGVNL